jgi:hypothetical protein
MMIGGIVQPMRIRMQKIKLTGEVAKPAGKCQKFWKENENHALG